MRNKIDYGIDLGTTNSAIVRMENGVPVVKKTDKQADTLPSCVYINKKKELQVGEIPYHNMKADAIRALRDFKKADSNTFIEFKRTMGTTHNYESSNYGKSISPVELSAEILKTLKSFISDENLNSIVITVPAKFLNPQNEATMQAAKLAGFKHVELLQEPVAAATAYGLGSKNKDGYWLVFDFGGGTFDAALIKSEEGILSVLDTDGDAWLGGKNLDEAIVDQIILPYLQENYAIESLLEDIEKKEILRSAVKFSAEEAKIQLSLKESWNILSNLGDLPFEDENGEEPEIDITINQEDLEKVFMPIFQKAIDITNNLISRNNLKGTDLGALILVGGPTYSPILRKMLKEQVSENIDTSVDPMTVVAKGAALFASTISISDEVKEISRDSTKIQLDIKYEATTVELDSLINLKILKDKSSELLPDKIFVEVTRFDGGWSSGKKIIGEKASIIEVLLVEGRSNSFDITLYDETGNKLECQPNQFSVLQGIGGLDGMQVLPYHIGIGKFFISEGKDLFKSIPNLEKNKPLRNGIVGILNDNRTRSAIRPGIASDKLRIPIYQGEFGADGSNPLLNNLVTEVVITGEDLPALLPEGSEVEITIKIDSSQLMKFSAYFPLLNHTEELQVDINNTEPPTEELLNNEISKAKKVAKKVNDSDVSNNLAELEVQLENEKGSADGKMKILDSLRKELLILDKAEKLAEWPKIEKALKDSFFEWEELINKIEDNNDDGEIDIDKVKSNNIEFKNTIEQIIRQKDSKAAKELTDIIVGLIIELRNSLTGGDVDRRRIEYHDKEFNNISWKDKNKARVLVNQGLKLIEEGKTNQLKSILYQIWDLRIDSDEGGDTLS
jgi:molecular chaperone DnaK